MMWNDLFCSCLDVVSIWWQVLIFVIIGNFWIVRTNFASLMTLNNCENLAETRSYIFRWRSRCCRRGLCLKLPNRELKQPRRRRQQLKHHKFAYLTMKNIIFARFARAFFIFWHFLDVLVLSTTWNDLFCGCVDDVSIWWQMFSFVYLYPKRWFQFNSRIVRTDFSSIMTLNN